MRKTITGILAFLAMLILILDGKTAFLGAKEGITLCLSVVIPSLFPFFLISIILTDSLTGLSFPFLRPVSKILGIPAGAEGILISAFLGGYPAGAQSISLAYRAGQLRKEDAERMLAFCNNAGPSFLFGMTASLFEAGWIPWALWGIHILSAVITAVLLPGGTHCTAVCRAKSARTLTQAMGSAIQIMSGVCGWVIIFRVLIRFLRRWILWKLPPVLEVAVMGILELSNGCCALINIPNSDARFILCSAFLALGGVCVAMQTASAANGLALRRYYPGKLLQTFFSLILSTATVYGYGTISFIVAVILIIMLSKQKNRCSIPALIGV